MNHTDPAAVLALKSATVVSTADSNKSVLRRPIPAKSAESIVREWGATLSKENAPKPHERGQLAWARTEKLEELIAILKKEGYQ